MFVILENYWQYLKIHINTTWRYWFTLFDCVHKKWVGTRRFNTRQLLLFIFLQLVYSTLLRVFKQLKRNVYIKQTCTDLNINSYSKSVTPALKIAKPLKEYYLTFIDFTLTSLRYCHLYIRPHGYKYPPNIESKNIELYFSFSNEMIRGVNIERLNFKID